MRQSLYIVILLISLATLAFEITLTRIFSVTMWYHYAFMAISVAMLGMGAGAVKVYVAKFSELTDEEVYHKIGIYCIYFSFAMTIALLTLLAIPFIPRPTGIGIFSIVFIYVVAAVPFYFSGIVISLILTTKFIKQVNSLYASDLIGAALGSAIFYFFLNITDAITTIFFLSAISLLSSWFLFRKKLILIFTAVFLIFSFHNHYEKVFRVEWSKHIKSNYPILTDYEWTKWNPFSRITVKKMGNKPFGWGMSHRFNQDHPHYTIPQKYLEIDSAAATIITGKNRPITNLYHLGYDITNLAHHLVDNGKVATIGVGGGRDILSALYFGQKEIWGIEINGKILEAILSEYKHFTYDFNEMKNVFIVHDEARSFIERSHMKFDIIQASLIDSWSATASGAFVLTENSLYTVEGWKVFFKHLTDDGVITMSRWYFKKRPGELLRLTSLAYTTLIELGIKDPEKHILLATSLYSAKDRPDNFGTGTIIVSKKPFNEDKIDLFLNTCHKYSFQPVFSSGKESPSLFKDLIDQKKRDALINTYPLNLSAPTDNSPFFFNMLKIHAALTNQYIDNEGPMATNLKAVTNLITLLVTVIILSLLLIIIPVWLKMEGKGLKMLFHPFSIYFAAIGLAFMLVEISHLQKFTVFLGHPTYSLLVVLFSLLIFTGFGSYFSKKLTNRLGPISILLILLIAITIMGTLNMFILPKISFSSITYRIIYCFGSMALIGFALGIPFPIGMSLLPNDKKEWGPWLWGINAALGVVSSVLAIIISIFINIPTTFYFGVISYVVAILSILIITRTTVSPR